MSAAIKTDPVAEFFVGQTCTYHQLVDDKLVRGYADITGDHNKIHVDDAFAARTKFGRADAGSWDGLYESVGELPRAGVYQRYGNACGDDHHAAAEERREDQYGSDEADRRGGRGRCVHGEAAWLADENLM